MHRDVKPGNILIDAVSGLSEHVYLSDFGLSKGIMSSAGLTGTGQFLGTPDYAAPEQITGKRLDGRADQYALAWIRCSPARWPNPPMTGTRTAASSPLPCARRAPIRRAPVRPALARALALVSVRPPASMLIGNLPPPNR